MLGAYNVASLTTLCGACWGVQCFPYGRFVASVPASDAAEAPAGAATAAPLGGKSDKLHLV